MLNPKSIIATSYSLLRLARWGMKEEKKDVGDMAEMELQKPYRFWIWAMASAILRLFFIFFPDNFNLPSRPELLKVTGRSSHRCHHTQDQCIMALHCCSPFSVRSQVKGLKGNRVIICADIFSAVLLRATGQKLQTSYRRNLRLLGVLRSSQNRGILPCGDIAALVYLWNPFTILSCVGTSSSGCIWVNHGHTFVSLSSKFGDSIDLSVGIWFRCPSY